MGTWAHVLVPLDHRGCLEKTVLSASCLGESYIVQSSFYTYVYTHAHTTHFSSLWLQPLLIIDHFVIVAVHIEATRGLYFHHKLCSVWAREMWPLKSLRP